MLSYRNRLQIAELSAITLPLVLVMIGRSALSSPPPIATTIQVSGPTVAHPAAGALKPLTAEQTKAKDWVRQLPANLELVSPLNHPVEIVIAPEPTPEPEPEVVKPLPPRINPVNGLKLTGVLGNEEGKLAAINGKIYRIGDEVRKGLKLTSIDPRDSVVTLTDSKGEMYTLKRELPTSNDEPRR